jgi:hypothetical protein
LRGLSSFCRVQEPPRCPGAPASQTPLESWRVAKSGPTLNCWRCP